jgi:hypothetical protein
MTTAAPAMTAPPGTGRERAVTYLPSELDQRVRTWAALLGLPASHLLARVIAEATPSRDQLAEMVQLAPENDGSAGAETPTLRNRTPDHR